MPTPSYSFAKASEADIPMMVAWMNTSEVRQWFAAPSDHLRVAKGDVANPALDVRIVHHDNTPFALVQDYDAHHWPKPHFTALPKGSRAMAAYIGVPNMLGKSHGRRFLAQRAAALCNAGAPLVAIDPEATNKRAISAYRAAGFSGDVEMIDEDGIAVLPMIYKKESSQ